MDDMMSKISELLDDPSSAEKIKQIAQSFSGETDTSPNNKQSPLAAISPSSDKMKRNIALLNAITPYMRPSRSEKIASAIKAIQIIDILSKAR